MAKLEGVDAERDEHEGAQVFRSETLFGKRAEAVILHRGRRYVLRRTRQNKLILNRLDGDEGESDGER